MLDASRAVVSRTRTPLDASPPVAPFGCSVGFGGKWVVGAVVGAALEEDGALVVLLVDGVVGRSGSGVFVSVYKMSAVLLRFATFHLTLSSARVT